MRKKRLKKLGGTKARSTKRDTSFSSFVQDPVISLAILVFAFIALFLSLHQFLVSRGF